jgi:hypothetical protein
MTTALAQVPELVRFYRQHNLVMINAQPIWRATFEADLTGTGARGLFPTPERLPLVCLPPLDGQAGM